MAGIAFAVALIPAAAALVQPAPAAGAYGIELAQCPLEVLHRKDHAARREA